MAQPTRGPSRSVAEYAGRGGWFIALVALLVLALYLPSLNFGLIWDDPTWYSQATDHPVREIVTSLSTYQFYRPLTILFNRLLVNAQGIVLARLAHALQIVVHLAVAWLTGLVALRLGASLWAARFSALILAAHPFAYQAVAWQAPQQPAALLAVLAAYLIAERYVDKRRVGSLILSLALYAVALLIQESALPFVALLAWPVMRRWRSLRWRERWWPALYGLLALAYGLIWLWVPRREGVTGGGLQLDVLAYLLQGVAYPLAAGMARLPLKWSAAGVAVACGVAWLVLALAEGRSERRGGLLASALILLGIAPTFIGLPWDYVKIGSRLFYPAILGTALLWGRWLGWSAESSAHVWRRLLAGALALALFGVALGQWAAFDRLYRLGTQHLQSADRVLAGCPDDRLLLVNFPDRLALRRHPYPLGYWGLVLAPVSQDMAGFARATLGQSAQAECRAVHVHGWQERQDGPYQVDLRGEDTSAELLVQLAGQANAVWLTEYAAFGRMTLHDVGSLAQGAAQGGQLTLGETLRLMRPPSVCLSDDGRLCVAADWALIRQAAPGDTLFVHLLTAEGSFAAGQDGDLLGGLLPLEFVSPVAGLRDVRYLDVGSLAEGAYSLTLGLYNRTTGERYSAVWTNGSRAANDEPVVAEVALP